MEFYILEGVQNQLEELNSDACWSVNTYDTSLKLISNNALQISENGSSYRGINTKANDVARVRTVDEWVNKFRVQPEASDVGLWSLVLFVEYITGTLFTSVVIVSVQGTSALKKAE